MKHFFFFLSLFLFTSCFESSCIFTPYEPPEMKLEGISEEPTSIMDEVENVIVTEDYQERKRQRQEEGSIMDQLNDGDDIQFLVNDGSQDIDEESDVAQEYQQAFENVGGAGITIEADGKTTFEGFDSDK